MRTALAYLAFATVLPTLGLAADVSGSLLLGQTADDEVTRHADASARFQLGGAADLTGRLDFGLTSVGDEDVGYASAGLGTSFGSIDVGLPRSILEAGPMPDPARFNASTTRGTFRPLAAEAALDEGLTGGVRVLAERGGLQLGTSVHGRDDEADPYVVGVAGRYDLAVGETEDTVALYGGMESDGEVERFRLGTEVTLGRAIAAVDLLRTGDDGASASQVALGLAVSERITFGVTGLLEDDGIEEDPTSRVGLGAAVELTRGGILRGGIDTSDTDDYAIDVEIGFQF